MKKKIIVSLLAILTVIPLVLVHPKAAGSTLNGSGTSNYGSYNYQFSVILEQTEIGFNWGAEGLGLNIPLATGSSFNINFQFKDTYTGYVQFTLKSNTGVGYRLDECYWGVNGGYFNSSYLPSLTTVSTSKQFRIYVYNATEFSFTIVSPNVNTFHPTSTQYTGFGVTSFGYGLTDVGDIPDIAADLDLYLPGMSTNLTNIYNSLGYTSTNTLQNDINIIKNAIDGLEGYTDQIEPYLNQLINFQRIQTFEVWQQLALWWGASMGELQYDGNFPYFFYDSTLNTGQANNLKRIKIGNKRTTTLVFYSTVNQISQYYNIYGSHAEDVDVTWSISTAVPGYPLYLYRVNFKNNYNGSNFISIEFTRDMTIYPLFLGDSLNIPEEVSILMGTEYENTYTRLLQQISNGIGGSSYDTSQYEQYEQSIDNLNDSMRDRFNNSETSFQNNLNDIFVPDNEQVGGDSNTLFQQFHFNAINSLFGDFLGDIFEIAPALKYIMLFGLLLLVLGVLI